MKAWNDITEHHTPWSTSEGEYFIDMGVKIERLHSGAFRIYNANTPTHHFEYIERKDLYSLIFGPKINKSQVMTSFSEALINIK